MFVLDASVTMAWGLRDEESDYATSILDALAQDTAVVPALWVAEVSNILQVSIQRKRISEKAAHEFLDALENLPIVIEYEQPSLKDLLSFSKNYNLTSYDALYLHIAITKKIPISTLDKSIRKAAQIANVPLYRASANSDFN